MPIVRRYDRVTIPSSKRTPEGFLRVDGSKIARTGIQIYRRGDNSEYREFRPPEEVFSDETLESFALVPMTDGHPSQLLTAEDAKAHAVGAVGAPIKGGTAAGAEWIRADISVWDAEAIKSIEGGRVELSAGYTCELDETPGEWNGQKYDAVQRKIRANHLALVDVARAGPEARLKLDRMDGEQVVEKSDRAKEISVKLNIKTERVNLAPGCARDSVASKMPIKIKLDGFEIEVADDNARTMIERAIEKAKADGAKLAADVQAKLDSEVTAHGETKKKLAASEQALKDSADGKMVKCDACDGSGKVDGAKCDECSGEGKYMMDAAVLAKRDARVAARAEKAAEAKVAARAQLIADGRAHLGDTAGVEKMTDGAIKIAVAKKYNPKLDVEKMPEAGIQALFDAALVAHRPATSAELARTGDSPLAAGLAPSSHADEGEAARVRMQQRNAGYNVKAAKPAAAQ